jgi:hypothetical protein
MSKCSLCFSVGAVLIVLLAGAPLIVAIGAGTYAEAYGCVLNEGFVNPCIVDGSDVGHTLYDLGMIGWFGSVTIPFGALALIVLIVVWIVISAVNRPLTKGRVA